MGAPRRRELRVKGPNSGVLDRHRCRAMKRGPPQVADLPKHSRCRDGEIRTHDPLTPHRDPPSAVGLTCPRYLKHPHQDHSTSVQDQHMTSAIKATPRHPRRRTPGLTERASPRVPLAGSIPLMVIGEHAGQSERSDPGNA